MIKSLICGLVLTVLVEAKDQENDGTFNHLLVIQRPIHHTCDKNSEISGIVKISYSAQQPLANEGEYVRIKVDANCFDGYGFDTNGDKYKIWLCDATKLERMH